MQAHMHCTYEGEYTGIYCFFSALDPIRDASRYPATPTVHESGTVWLQLHAESSGH